MIGFRQARSQQRPTAALRQLTHSIRLRALRLHPRSLSPYLAAAAAAAAAEVVVLVELEVEVEEGVV